MAKSVSDRRQILLWGEGKISLSWVYGLLSPSAETCNAPALGDTAQAALSHLDKPGAGLFQTHSAGALSRVLLGLQQSSWSAAHCTVYFHCVVFCIFAPFCASFSATSGSTKEQSLVNHLQFWFFQVMDLFFHKCGNFLVLLLKQRNHRPCIRGCYQIPISVSPWNNNFLKVYFQVHRAFMFTLLQFFYQDQKQSNM